MKPNETKPFLPYVTLEQILAFDKSRPETFTPSIFVNAVLEAFYEVNPLSARNVGKYLAINPAKLTNALEILTGYNFTELRNHWMLHEITRLEAEHPDWGPDKIARHIGYADRSALWRMFHRDVRKREYAEDKARYEANYKKNWEDNGLGKILSDISQRSETSKN